MGTEIVVAGRADFILLVRRSVAHAARALPGFDESNVMGGRIPEPDEV
jgi:hypothetical protein